MKILFIKQLFFPEPTARSLDFALELNKKGHEVQVLTGFPSYPHGKIYKGYGQRIFFKENIEGIEVIRVPIFPNQSNNSFLRIINYLSYAFSAVLFGIWRVDKPDIAFVYHGALPVGIPAIMLKLFRGVPFVYDINDLWPDTLSATGMLTNKILLKVVHKWCNLTYRLSNHITVLSNGFRLKLIDRGVQNDKITIINHWSRDQIDIDINKGSRIALKYPKNNFNVLYAGNVGNAQGLDTIIKGLETIQESHPNILLTILGDGVDKNRITQYVTELNITNVRFLNRVSSQIVGLHLNAADLLLVHLKDDPLFRITIPSKIIGYMAAGKPIIMGIRGDSKDIITKAKCGVTFEPQNYLDFIKKLNSVSLLDQNQRDVLGLNARTYYDKHFTIESGTNKFIDVFTNVISNTK